MKKRFHNKIMIASVILVLIVSLAACGGKADSGATDETTESKPPESSATVSKGKDSAVDASENAKTKAEADTKPVETQPETKPESTKSTEKPTEKSAEKPTEKPETQPEEEPAEEPIEEPAEEPAEHTHSWNEHTVTEQVWVSKIVPVYETQKVQTGTHKVSDGIFWHCNCGAVVPQSEGKAHRFAHIEAGEMDNGQNQEHFHDEPVYEDQQVQVGTEDKSYWETESYVDYVYCSECGAKK